MLDIPSLITNSDTGLTQALVDKILSTQKTKKGFILSETTKTILDALLKQINSLFFYLLLGAIILTLLFAQEKVDAIIITIILILNVVIGFSQDYKASKAAQKLQSLTTQLIRTKRDGVVVELPITKVLQRDIVEYQSGDIVSTDTYCLISTNCSVDQSILTGETLPKKVSINLVVPAGSIVITGSLLGQVIGVGETSSLTDFSKSLGKVEKKNQFETLVEKVSLALLAVCGIGLIAIFVLNVALLGSMTVIEFMLFGVSMIIGIVPESFPLIVTLLLTNEALHLSRHGVLIKRLSVLEDIGTLRFLLTDKTGTLTKNELSVSELYSPNNTLQDIAVTLAHSNYERGYMEKVFDAALATLKNNPNTITLIESIPFDYTVGYAQYNCSKGIVIVRGSPSKILALCKGGYSDYNNLIIQQEKIGVRLLAYAKQTKTGFEMLGMVLFKDPLKPGIIAQLTTLEEIQVDVKILSGDSLAVTSYVAEEAKIIRPALLQIQTQQLTSTSVLSYTPTQLEEIQVFAGSSPTQKLDIIDQYNKLGTTAFLGEGVNDALALKKASVGIVVNNTSDVARQTADILLTKPGISPIAQAVKSGRTTYHKIVTYLLCTLAGNAGTMISLFGIAIFAKIIPLLPSQILLNNILSDVPFIVLITDIVHKQVQYKQPNLSTKSIITMILGFGILSSLFDFAYFGIFAGGSVESLRTGWFLFSLFSELLLLLTLRTIGSRDPKDLFRVSKPILFALSGSVIISLALTNVNGLQEWFRFVSLPVTNYLTMFTLLGAYFCANQLLKHWLK
jgi:P-type Mg2+ transporter